MDKERQNKHPGRKLESGSVRVVPIFRKPLDIDKLGNAFLSLAIKLAEEKAAAKTNDSRVKNSPIQTESDNGGESHE